MPQGKNVALAIVRRSRERLRMMEPRHTAASRCYLFAARACQLAARLAIRAGALGVGISALKRGCAFAGASVAAMKRVEPRGSVRP